MDEETEGQSDRQAIRETDRQSGSQTDREPDRQTDNGIFTGPGHHFPQHMGGQPNSWFA